MLEGSCDVIEMAEVSGSGIGSRLEAWEDLWLMSELQLGMEQGCCLS
jgi:hypothetical protein